MKTNKKAKNKKTNSKSKKKRRINVYGVLKKYGAPFWDPPESDLSLEEAIVLGLKYATKDGHALMQGIVPFVLTINSKNIDIELLLSLLKTDRQRQLLGYFADFSYQFKKSKKMQLLKETLYKNDFKELNLMGRPIEGFLKLVMENRNNPTAKKWNIQTIDELEGHFVRFKKWLSVR